MTILKYTNFETPKDVRDDKTLSNEQKLTLLHKWATDEEALQRAASEGLAGGSHSNLRAVQAAISEITETPKRSELETSLREGELRPLKRQVEGIFGTKPH